MEKKNTFKLEITKKPWYEWLLWALWLFLVIFTAQNAIASGAEYEPQAATIFWALFAILLVGGGIVFYIRRQEQTT